MTPTKNEWEERFCVFYLKEFGIKCPDHSPCNGLDCIKIFIGAEIAKSEAETLTKVLEVVEKSLDDFLAQGVITSANISAKDQALGFHRGKTWSIGYWEAIADVKKKLKSHLFSDLTDKLTHITKE